MGGLFPLGKKTLPVQIRLGELLVLGTWSKWTSGRWTKTKAHRRLESPFLCFCVPRCRDICPHHMGPCDFPSAAMQIVPPPKLSLERGGGREEGLEQRGASGLILNPRNTRRGILAKNLVEFSS